MKIRSTRPLALIGGGGHALSVLECISADTEVIGYVDFEEKDIMPLPLLADDRNFLEQVSPLEYDVLFTFVSGADCSLQARRKVIEKYRDFSSPVIVASTAWTARDVEIGSGTVLLQRTVVNAASRIGQHSIINTGAIVEHNCTVGSNTFIGPGTIICGGVEIGDNVYISAGTIIKPGVHIASDVFVGIGSVINNDLEAGGRYVGMPARKIK